MSYLPQIQNLAKKYSKRSLEFSYEDLVAEGVLVWEEARFLPMENPNAFLYRAVQNRFIRLTERSNSVGGEILTEEFLSDETWDPERVAAFRERLERLSPNSKKVLQFIGENWEEIIVGAKGAAGRMLKASLRRELKKAYGWGWNASARCIEEIEEALS